MQQMRTVAAVALVCICATADAVTPWRIRREARTTEVVDAYLWAGSPDLNTGTSESLYLGDVSGEKVIVLRFDVGFVPKGARVTRARVFLTPSSVGPTLARVHAATAPWVEDGVSWNGFDAGFDPAVVATFQPMDAVFDVTGLVQQWVDGRPNHGLYLDQPPGMAASIYASSNVPEVDRRPLMELELTTPTPLETAVLPASGDAYVWSANPKLNYCCTGYDTSGNYMGGDKVALLKFDVAGLPAGATVMSAVLRLRHDPGYPTNPNRVQAAAQAWDDATVTWATFGGVPAAAPDIVFEPNDDGGYTEVEVRSIVQPWVDGAPNHGFVLDEDGNEATWWFSKEATADRRPELRVRFTRAVVDAGAVVPDAGADPTDGGTVAGARKLGLGCSATPGGWALLALVSVLRRRRPRSR